MNAILAQLIGQALVKRGGALSSLVNGAKTAGPALASVPGKALRASKMGLGAGVVGLLGEAGVKTMNNWAHGNPDIGEPTFSERQIGDISNIAANVSQLRPLVQSTVQAAAQGLDMSPNAQKMLDALSNISNPAVRSQILGDSMNALNTGATSIAQNIGNVAGSTIGRSVGHGLAQGVWSDLVKHPVATLGGAAAFGAGPAIVYDAVTYKRRKEEAERNKAIMRYILKQEKQGYEKTAAVDAKGLFNKLIYRSTGTPSSKLTELAGKFPNNSIVPNGALDRIKGYPQTLVNNSLSRNGIKTGLLGSAGLGLGVSAKQYTSGDTDYNKAYSTPWNSIKSVVKNMSVVPEALFKGLEIGAVQHMDFGHSMTGDKLKTISGNLNGATNPIPRPNDPSYRPAKIEFSKNTIKRLSTGDLIGEKPEVTSPQSSLKDYLPYAGMLGLASFPMPAYLTYRHFANKKLNKLEDQTANLQERTEASNGAANKLA